VRGRLAVLALLDEKNKNKKIGLLCATEQGCHDSFLDIMKIIADEYCFLAKDCLILVNMKEVKNNGTGSVLKVINIKDKPELAPKHHPQWITFNELGEIKK
jgi:hypothetical protein